MIWMVVMAVKSVGDRGHWYKSPAYPASATPIWPKRCLGYQDILIQIPEKVTSCLRIFFIQVSSQSFNLNNSQVSYPCLVMMVRLTNITGRRAGVHPSQLIGLAAGDTAHLSPERTTETSWALREPQRHREPWENQRDILSPEGTTETVCFVRRRPLPTPAS